MERMNKNQNIAEQLTHDIETKQNLYSAGLINEVEKADDHLQQGLGYFAAEDFEV